MFETNIIIPIKLNKEERISLINNISKDLEMDIYLGFGSGEFDTVIELLLNVVGNDSFYEMYLNSFEGVNLDVVLQSILETQNF